jgi:hypothetical protein
LDRNTLYYPDRCIFAEYIVVALSKNLSQRV